MALVVLCSASGSPGVTCTAVGLALTWSRPVLLVEGDPTGGSPVLAGYLRAQAAPPGSLVDLATAGRHGDLAAAVARATMPLPNPWGAQVSLLPGTRTHAQASSLTPWWEPLGEVFRSLEATGQDAIVDAGRLGLAGSPEPLLRAADLTLLVLRSDLVNLAAARSWADTLRERSEQAGNPTNLALLIVGPGRPYTPREISSVLKLPVVATVAHDPATAAVFTSGAKATRKIESTLLVRNLRTAVDAIGAALGPATDQPVTERRQASVVSAG